MQTISSLIEDLNAPCVFNKDGSRALSGNDMLQALRTEIARTILPRQLTFLDDKGRSITCVAASGRVVEVGPHSEDAKFDMTELETFAATATGLFVQTRLLNDIATEAPIAAAPKVTSECQLVALLTYNSTSYLTFANDIEYEAVGHQEELEKLSALAGQGMFDPEDGSRFAAFVSSDPEDLTVVACTINNRVLLALAASHDLPEIRQAWQSSI